MSINNKPFFFPEVVVDKIPKFKYQQLYKSNVLFGEGRKQESNAAIIVKPLEAR
jgi:hypothetical protein